MPASTSPAFLKSPKIAIIVSRYNRTVTDHLRAGSVEVFLAAGGDDARLTIVEAPGTFELPVLCLEAALDERHDGVVALGCVIRGETDHDRYIASSVADALQEIALDTGVPVALGVLTCNTIAQAVARSGGKDGSGPDNKGRDAMRAVLATIAAQRALRAGSAGDVGVRFALPEDPPDKARGTTPRKTPTRATRSSRTR